MIDLKKKIIILSVTLLSLSIFLPNNCIAFDSKTYEWKDIGKAFIIEGGHNMKKKGTFIVKFDLSSDFKGTAKTKDLYVDKKGKLGQWYVFILRVNGSIGYKVRKKMKIKTKHLKLGPNELKFMVTDKQGGTAIGMAKTTMTIRKLSFSEFY